MTPTSSELCPSALYGEGLVLAVLAMLEALRVAPGGSAPPITCVARRGLRLPGRDEKPGVSDRTGKLG
jgi:hypothetical protein